MLNLSKSEVEDIIYVIINEFDEENVQYAQIKKIEFNVNGKSKSMFQIIDVSQKILYTKQSEHLEFLSLVN